MIRVIATAFVILRRVLELSFALLCLAIALAGMLLMAVPLWIANRRAEAKSGRATVEPMR